MLRVDSFHLSVILSGNTATDMPAQRPVSWVILAPVELAIKITIIASKRKSTRRHLSPNYCNLKLNLLKATGDMMYSGIFFRLKSYCLNADFFRRKHGSQKSTK
jgi:hypothetical protein